MKPASNPIPDGFHAVTPHLVCRGAERALEFYKNAFGAEIQSVSKDDGGLVTHAQLKIGDSILMLSDEYPAYGCVSPLSIGGTGVMLHIYTADVDGMFTRAVAAGAKATMPLMDAFWGDRYGQLLDPYGHKWSIAAHQRDMTPEEVRAEAQKAFAAMAKEKSASN